MNYSMTLTGGMNARRDAKVIGYKMTDTPNNIIALLPAGTIAEGDALSADGKWLEVLMINGMQVAEPTFLATYTTSGKLEITPPPPVYPDFVYDASTESEWPIEVFHNDISIGIFDGVIRVVSKNPTLKLT